MKAAWILVILPGLALVGCTEPHYGYGTSGRQVISAGAPVRNPSDVALETTLRSELSRYGDLASVSPNVQIYSQNGTVTLSGSVPNDRDRQMIDSVVRTTPGVVSVNDQLQVSYPPTGLAAQPPPVYSPPPPAPIYVNPQPQVITPAPSVIPGQNPYGRIQAATLNDQAIAQAITTRMQDDSIPSTWLQDVTITITDGNVYLQGLVDSRQERQAIVSAAQRAHGVRAVYDQLQVR